MKIRCGSHCIAAGKGEDKFSVMSSHTDQGCPTISSFFVFDGHAGSKAAVFCAEYFTRRVVDRVCVLCRSLDSEVAQLVFQHPLDFDAVMSESIRATCVEMDTNVRMRDASGTTLSGVFIVVDALSASTRVYCANVGDSRSVLFTAPRKLATDTSSPYMVARTLDSELSHWQEDGAVNIRAGATYALSTDHKLSNGKERRRLQSAEPQKLEWHPYPTRVLEIGVQASMSASQDSSSQVEIRLSPLTTDLASIAPEVLDTGDGQALSPADCLVERRQRREASFIGNRMSAEGTEVGPEALFGRFNVSLTMTRSIGDKFAARSCLALPDVTLAVLDLSMHVRLVLGSDGLWDVLSDKWIAGMVFREATAASAAKRIAEVAAETRRKYVEHIDDVTVLVVDLCATHSGSAPRFGGGLGGCCVPS